MGYNQYMHRTGARAGSAMKIRNQYTKQFGIQYYLIVEGESDEHFFENILDCQVCKVVNLEGKDHVIEYIEQQNRARKKGYLGIVDADFEHITGVTSTQDNIILTDTHDLEMLMLSSRPNMRRVYSELTDNLLIQNYEAKVKKAFMDSVIDAAYDIGLLKLVAGRNKYKINMQDLPYVDVVDDNFSVNIDELIRRIKGRHNEYDLKTDYNAEKQKTYDRYQIACGHDVTNILAISVAAVESGGLGYGRKRPVNKNKIEELLRAIYDFANFILTDLFKSIVKWEKENGIKILDQNILNAA